MLHEPTCADSRSRKEEQVTDEQVKDPVCGMMIRPSEAVATAEHNGQTYYFCSEDCAESFRDDPENYVSG